MPVPTLVTDLSTTVASNSPAGSDNVFPDLDNYLRTLSAFLASIRDNSGNGWVSPYLPLAGGTVTGATTFSNTVTGTKFIPTGTSATGNGMYLPATNTLGFSTNGAEVARLDSSGNLGIGTSSPGVRVDASGQVRALEAGTGSGNGGLIGSTASADGNAGVLFQTNSASRWNLTTSGTAGANLRIYNYALASTVATFDASGNLGIGTASPAAKLDVNGLIRGTVGSSTLEAIGAGDLTINASNAAGQIAFRTAGAERARIDSSGNLLVGTAATTGSLSNTTKLVAGVVSSYSGTVSAAQNTATTMFAVPTPANGATFLVTVTLAVPDVGSTYTVLGLLRCASTTTSYTNILTAASLTVAMSGTNLQVTQSSGLTQTVQWSLLRLV